MMRRLGRNSGHSAYWLLSVIALLGFACFPAFAEADSSSIQYEEALPTAKGTSTIPPHSPSAHASTAGGGVSAPSQSENQTPSAGGPTSAGAPVSKTDRRGAAHSRQKNGAGLAGANRARAPGQPNGAIQTTSPGGSSPLVPILIAIAALAAISISAVMVRQRRQRHSPGSAVSPKAS